MQVQISQVKKSHPPNEPIQWQTVPSKNNSHHPLKRNRHTAVLYKGMLYIYGGVCDQMNLNIIYKYDFICNQWIRFTTNFPANFSIQQIIQGHSAVMYFSNMHVFGGIKKNGQYTNQFWSLNLDTFYWKKIQQKGDVFPSPRSNCNMFLYKSMIVLYGGVNQNQILNDFYFYKFDSKSWFVGDTQLYEDKISNRLNPGVCTNKQYVYIFGGEQQRSSIAKNENNIQQKHYNYLNDFYRVQLTFRTTSIKPQVHATKILSKLTPPARSGHALISCENNQYLFLIGGQHELKQYNCEKSNQSDVWIYNVDTILWYCIKTTCSQFRSRVLFTNFEYQNKIYTFGGFDYFSQVTDQISKLEINFSEMNFQVIPSQVACTHCIENSDNSYHSYYYLPSQMIATVIQSLEFTFSAFGLLIDNSLMSGSKQCNIIYLNMQRQKYCLIEDNGSSKFWQSNEEFTEQMVYFTSPSVLRQEPKQHRVVVNDTKQKKNIRVLESDTLIQKRKLYCHNLKIGSLRLGNSFLYINRDQKNKRVVLYRKQMRGDQEVYAIYYYILNQGKYLDSAMYTSRKIIDEQYKNYIKIANQRKNMNNFLFIFDWSQVQGQNGELQCELVSQYHQNDLTLHKNKQLMVHLENLGYSLYQSLQISLRAYISMLYIKNQQMLISFGVKQSKLQPVKTQMFLQKIDKLLKNKLLIDLDDAFQFPCKFLQIYFNPDLKKKIGTFHNGVLLYHKNRLIDRYKYKLGTLFDKKKHKIGCSNNLLPLFGYISLPDTFPVNILKNDFIMGGLLQSLYSRLKFVKRAMKRKTQYQIKTTKIPIQSNQDNGQHPTKKIKLNQ